MNYYNRWQRPDLELGSAARRIRLPLAPSRERRRLQAYLGLLVLDGCALMLSFALADFIYSGQFGGPAGLLAAKLVLPVFWTAALALSAYSVSALMSASYRTWRLLLSLAASAVLVSFVTFMLKNSALLSRGTTLLGLGIAAVAILAARRMAEPLIRRLLGDTAINLLVIDDGGHPVRLAHAFHIDAREHRLSPDLDDPHMLDRIGLYMLNMDRVVVSCPRERRADWALIFKGANVQGEIVDIEVRELGVLGANRGHQWGSLVVSAGPLGMRARALKRGFDLVLTAIALVLVLPLLALTALAILIEDGRPIFFVQQRVGRGNTFFGVYKFRSMRADRSDPAGAVSTAREDHRVTRVGRIIRRFSIDELPQLFNVLEGTMSLVGPRPHAIGSQAGEKLFWQVDRRYWLRHSLKPGLTGLAQVRGYRGATECESDLSGRLNADLEYVNGWSIGRDISILVATARVLVHPRAY